MAQVFIYNFTNVTATQAAMISTTTSTGPMLLNAVIFNTPAFGTNKFQVYNGTSTSGSLIANLIPQGSSTNTAPFAIEYNIMCPSGIFFDNTGGTSGDVTVTWA